jgi:hypothetical protein
MSGIDVVRADAFLLAGRVERYGADVLSQQVCDQLERQRIALLAQAVRMLQTYRAVLKLMEEQLHDGAAAVLRAMLEQHFVFVAVSKDAGLLKVAVIQEQGEQKKALNALRTLAPGSRPSYLTNDALAVEIALRETSKFDVQKWAHDAGLEDMYQTLYRLLSVNAHGALHALNEYLDMSDDGIVSGIRSRILPVRSIDFLLVSIGILLNAVACLDAQPMTEVRRAQREQLGSEWEALRTRYYTITDTFCPPSEGSGVSQSVRGASSPTVA